MTDWAALSVIAALVGAAISIVTPILRLNTVITKLSATVDSLAKNLETLTSENTRSHARLHGRIDELVFREQFRGLPLKKDQPLKYGTQEGYTLDAITGATQTSTAVLKTLNNMTDQVIFNGEVE